MEKKKNQYYKGVLLPK